MHLSTQRQKILFASVVGPHGVDAADSRFKNPMSLMSNQVTRGQRHYTVQMYQRTFAYDLFGVNLDADVAILDFPSEAQLLATLAAERWDRVGLSGIMTNLEKVLRTYGLVRHALPGVPIDLGGHVVNDDEVTRLLAGRMRALCPTERFTVWQPPGEAEGSDALPAWIAAQGWSGPGVTFVRRDGLEYYRQLPGVGLRRDDAIFAPLVESSFDKRALGISVPRMQAGLVIPDVGCPKRCNFCTTSAKFGGRFVPFLDSAEDLLAVADAHARHGVEEMFVMSENFSVDTRRALRLLELMEAQHKPYRWGVFSSADTLVRLGIETIVKLGFCFVWIGLEESTGTAYRKVHGLDLQALVRDLQAHGIEVLGSTILGFPHQTPADLDREIAHALSFGCTYNQFMLYMAMPGTPLWREMQERGLLKADFPWPDIHGQKVQNWVHPLVSDGQIESRLDQAFAQDYQVLGPSLFRMVRTHWDGYRNTAGWDHELVQRRRATLQRSFPTYVALLDAMHRDLRAEGHAVAPQVRALRDELAAACGWRGRVAARAMGPYLYVKLLAEKRRYQASQRRREAENPRCLLTYHGHFEHRHPAGVPRPGPAPEAVAIRRPVACVPASRLAARAS